MRAWALVAVLVLFLPIAAHAQTPMNNIIISPESNLVQVTIDGELDDDGKIVLVIRGDFGSGMEAFQQTHTLTQENPTNVFELDYAFLENEPYTATVTNGYTTKTVQWTPLPSEQQNSQQSAPQNQETSQVSTSEESQSVITETESQTNSDSDDKITSLTEENEFLKQEVEKKDAVIMEQVKVIQGLASQLTSAVYDGTSANLVYVAENQEELIKSLTEENEFLRQEIEKKDAVIMEQIKVIQDLAAKIKNTVYGFSLNSLMIA